MSPHTLRWLGRIVAVTGLAVLVMGADHCPDKIANDLFVLYSTRLSTGDFAVYLHPKEFPAGTRFAADVPGGAAPARIWKCANSCRLAMIDFEPRAHYSHEVEIVTYDIETGEFDPGPAEWWPFDIDTGDRFFRTVADRRKAAEVCSGGDCRALFPGSAPVLHVSSMLHPIMQKPTPGPPPTPSTVWAMVVNGYDDPEDTFDNDTDGMVQVLRGMKVPDWRTCYLTDAAAPSGVEVDGEARVANINKAFLFLEGLYDGDPTTVSNAAAVNPCGVTPLVSNIKAECSEFIFFMSTHGYPDTLSCNHHLDPLGYIKKSDLVQLIDGVKCKHKTIVIEACKSGTLFSGLDGPDRSVFVSSGETTLSFQDKDPFCAQDPPQCNTSDPKKHDPNPGDAGSEVVWGFLEAFGTASADGGAKDGRISFDEAVSYAVAKNASKAIPEWSAPAALPWFPFSSGLVLQPTGVKITDKPSQKVISPNQPGIGVPFVPKGGISHFVLGIKNTGSDYLGVTTLRMHAENPPGTPVMPNGHAWTVIVPGLDPKVSGKYEISWDAGCEIDTSDQPKLVFTVDSPQASAAVNQATQKKELAVKVSAPATGICPIGCCTTSS